ncbi:interferon lambda receptor 1 isoform X2 [Engystomops pustulosus]
MTFWHLNHTVRVRAVYPSISSWVEIENIQYTSLVDPEPPILTIKRGDGFISPKAFTEQPVCVPQIIFKMSLKYFVVMWKDYNSNESIREQELDEPTVTIKTLGYEGEYCIAARTIYVNDKIKKSKLSDSICLHFPQKDGYNRTAFVFLLFFGIFVAVVVVVIFPICIKITQKSKNPKTLDFSNTKCRQDPCLSELNPDIYDSLTIYNVEQESSTKSLLPNTHDDGVSIYSTGGQGYMMRPTMQISDCQGQEYTSFKGLELNSSSDKSSSGCTCPNTSGSDSDMLFKTQSNQTYNCHNVIDVNDSRDIQICCLTASNQFDSLTIPSPNSLLNIPIHTLCVGNNNLVDHSDGDSGDQFLTDSEDDLSTDYKASDSKYPFQNYKTNDWRSGYTQRTSLS